MPGPDDPRGPNPLRPAEIALATTATVVGERAPFITSVRMRTPDQPPLVWQLPLGRVRLATVRSAGHVVEAYDPDRRTFFLPVRGVFSATTPGGRLQARPGGAVLAPAGERRGLVRAPAAMDFLGISVAVPAASEGRPKGKYGSPSGREIATVAADAPAAALGEFLTYLVRQHARPDTVSHRAKVARAAEALILDLFAALDLAGDPARADEALPGEQTVRVAEDFMHAHADETLTIEYLARQVGVSPRALQLAFRARRGASPSAMLTSLRLDRARAQLLVPDPMATVTSIALISGFPHVGRFAALYRARVGETPSETLRRAR